MNADQILALKPEQYHRLFGEATYEADLKTLRKSWHPDRRPDEPKANEVFAHIGLLFESAKKAALAGEWFGSIRWTNKAGKEFRFNYKEARDFDMGRVFMGDKTIAFQFQEDHHAMAARQVERINQMKYANEGMREEFERFLPKHLNSDSGMLVMQRPESVVRLSDLPVFEPRHVGWLVNRLFNLALFVRYNALSHLALTPDNIWVDIKKHKVYLLSGWWYSVPLDSKVSEVPAELLDVYPAELLKTKVATSKVDATVIKWLGLKALGDATGTGSSLMKSKTVPIQMVKYLRSPSGDDTLAEFKRWEEVLKECFGASKFVELNLTLPY